jgi:hypothetical protein
LQKCVPRAGTRGSRGDVCGSLRDPAQLVLIVREQRMFFSKPETGYRCVEL